MLCNEIKSINIGEFKITFDSDDGFIGFVTVNGNQYEVTAKYNVCENALR